MSQASEGKEDSAEFGSILEDVQPEESEAPVEKSQNIEEQSDIEDDLEDQSLDKSSESGDENPEEEALEREAEAPSSERRTTVTALPSSPEEVVESLKRLRDDVGQISELSSEEGNLVRTFSLAFLKLMEPLAKNIPVDVEVLPRRLGRVERANIIPNGKLVLLHQNGRMESVDLVEVGNRDLLVTVVSDVLPKFKELVSERREKIEKRITFLSEITRELQNIADSFTTVT